MTPLERIDLEQERAAHDLYRSEQEIRHELLEQENAVLRYSFNTTMANYRSLVSQLESLGEKLKERRI